MFNENKYLCEIFGEIVKEVIDKKRKSNLLSNPEESSQSPKYSWKKCHKDLFDFEEEKNEVTINRSDSVTYSNHKELKISRCKTNLLDFEREVEDLYQISIYHCPTASSISCFFSRGRKLSSLEFLNDIDFSDELNCLICIYNILRGYQNEYDIDNILSETITFQKNKMESIKILERKIAILDTLLKCVENLPIDEQLKQKARIMIANTAKYTRAYFFIEEKHDILEIIQSLKFRLNNMIELEKHDTMDKLMPDNTLPTDYQEKFLTRRENLKIEYLVLAKSELINYARKFHKLISDYLKEPQFNAFNSNECVIKMNVKHDDKDQQSISPIKKPDLSEDINNFSRKEKPSKEKKTNRFIKFMNTVFCLCFSD